jgi:hypothetical protein
VGCWDGAVLNVAHAKIATSSECTHPEPRILPLAFSLCDKHLQEACYHSISPLHIMQLHVTKSLKQTSAHTRFASLQCHPPSSSEAANQATAWTEKYSIHSGSAAALSQFHRPTLLQRVYLLEHLPPVFPLLWDICNYTLLKDHLHIATIVGDLFVQNAENAVLPSHLFGPSLTSTKKSRSIHVLFFCE